jgi:hypothetical protein
LSVYSLGRFLLQPTRETDERVGAVDPQRALAASLGLLALAAFLFNWLNTNVNFTPEVQ